MVAIGTLAYKAVFDATDLTRGMMSSKQAFAAHKKIMQESQSPQDKYANGLANLQVLVARHPDMLQHQARLQGDLQREYLKQEQSVRQLTDSEAKRLHTLTAGERAAESAARAEDRLSRARKNGKTVIDANRTAGDTYARSLAHHNSLLKKGLIDYGTHSRAVGKLRQEYVSSLPVIGRFSGMLANPGAAAGVVALAGFAIAVRNVAKEMQHLDDLAKNAARLDMDPRAFAVLSRAAAHAGVEASQLFDAIGKLQKRVGEAAAGSTEAAAAFDRLGLSYEQLQAMSPQDAFLAVGQAIQKTEGNTNKLAVANKIFEESGRNLMTMLGMTRKEYDALQRSMQLRGELFTAAELARVEQVNDAIGDLHSSWRALWQNAAVDMAPALEQLVFVGEQLMIVNKIANAINFKKPEKLIEGAIAARDSGLADFAGGMFPTASKVMKGAGVPKFLDEYDKHVLNPKPAELDPVVAADTEQKKLDLAKKRLEVEQRIKQIASVTEQNGAAAMIQRQRDAMQQHRTASQPDPVMSPIGTVDLQADLSSKLPGDQALGASILAKQVSDVERRMQSDASDFEWERTELLREQLRIRERMLELTPEQEIQVKQQFMQQTDQRQLVEQQDERQRMAQGAKDAANKPASSITANSQEAYKLLTQGMRGENKAAEQKQKQALEESKKQTKLLEKVLNAIEDVDVMGSM